MPLLNDVRIALRMLFRTPVSTGVAVLSLALGIGANTAIFSLVDQVLLRSLPVREPERLVVVNSPGPNPGWKSQDVDLSVFSVPLFRDLQRETTPVLEGIAARSAAAVSVSFNGQTERAGTEVVSGNYFSVLGVNAWRGRTFTAEDDRTPGAHPVVVLGHNFWERRMGANPAVVGQKILLNGHPMTVLGVTPPSFRGSISGRVPDLYVPLTMKAQVSPGWKGFDERRWSWLNLLARLKPGVSATQAEAALKPRYHALLAEELRQMKTMPNERRRAEFQNRPLALLPGHQGINELRQTSETSLLVLMGMVGLVLLIACANVAGLLLARASGRQREFGVRLALGASRGVVVRQLLLESVLLAGMACVLGLIVASWTSSLLGQLVSDGGEGGRWFTGELDSRVLLFCMGVSLGTALLFGLMPALQATQPSLILALREQSAAVLSGVRTARLRQALVAGQLALSLCLLVGAGLFARSLLHLLTQNPGFRAERVMSFSVDPQLSGYSEERGQALYRGLLSRLAALPGVDAVGAGHIAILAGDNSGSNIMVEGHQASEEEDMTVGQNWVTPGYFATLSIPLVAGRDVQEQDGPTAPRVVVVNQEFVRRWGKGRNPVGLRMEWGANNKPKYEVQIVGVVANSQHASLTQKIQPMVYLPPQQDRPEARESGLRAMTFYLRTTQDGEAMGSTIRSLVRQADANLPVFRLRTLPELVRESAREQLVLASLTAAFGLLATLLAAVGLYGLVAHTVARRTGEIGLRMALGAERGMVRWLVLREMLVLLALGTAVGLPAAYALGRMARSALVGIQPLDPPAFGTGAIALLVVALLAAWLPAEAAARLDPVRALRQE